MELRVKLTAKEMFLFTITHFYKSLTGILSVITTAMVVGIVAVSWSSQSGAFRAVLLAGVAFIVCLQPFMLYAKSARQARDPQLGKEIFYKMDYNGVKVQQGREKANIGWRQITKVGKIPGIYVLYLSKATAYLIPERTLSGGKKGQFLKLLDQYVDREKRKDI